MNFGWVSLENKKLTWESEYDASFKGGSRSIYLKIRDKTLFVFKNLEKLVFQGKNMDKVNVKKFCKEILKSFCKKFLR